MDYKKLADLLFGEYNLKTPEEYLELYPKRDLPDGAVVTRFAPSPTGFLHFGGLFTSFVASRVAHQSGGKYILRIEDTDQERKVEGGEADIISGLAAFDITFDETPDNASSIYGPYRQSERKEIYMTFAKKLVEEGKAYPCFCSKDRLEGDREQQEVTKSLVGYYGPYAHCRNLSYEEVEAKVNAGEKFAIRLMVNSSLDTKIKVKDAIRGEMKLSDNYNDVVILKSDFLPPYNFAHVVDDTLMRVNLVVRGDEYIPSITQHLQIFIALGFKPIKYAHVAPVSKLDDGKKRKISKRKDPEAAVSFYHSEGYPAGSVQEYILTIANSNFEDWRKQNKKAPISDFKVAFNKMGFGGALFDFPKLNDVSKGVISRMSAEEIYDSLMRWTHKNDKDFDLLLEKYKEYSINVLNIEREIKRPRQDIAKWSDVKTINSYFYDDLFVLDKETDYEFGIKDVTSVDIIMILEKYISYYKPKDEKQVWFSNIKKIATEMEQFADDMKEFKLSPPDTFRAHYGNISTVIRVAITGKTQTPDLYEICKLLGADKVKKRCESAIKIWGEKYMFKPQ
jgi:glutamyl-tRNA synthetase